MFNRHPWLMQTPHLAPCLRHPQELPALLKRHAMQMWMRPTSAKAMLLGGVFRDFVQKL